MIFTPEVRLSFILSAEGSIPAQSLGGNANLFKSLIAYTGTYRLDEDRWILQVDFAWNAEWVDIEQTRYFHITGSELRMKTPWRVMPNLPENGLTRSIVRLLRCTEPS